CAMLMLRLEGGARGVCLLSQVCAGHKNQLMLEVNGSRGSLGWNLEQPNTLWLGHRDRPNQILPKDPTLLGAEAQPYAHYPGWHNEGYPDSFKNLFRDVYAAVREGGGMPPDPSWPTFQTGHRANVMVDAILQSAAERRWVDVPP
ncbi:MAG: gfo/Idh/MocA family oxidoreductase, partial [Caldilineae bacterium]